MVTTFSPPAKPKVKKKQPIPLIALGATAAILLVVVFILFSKSNSESARANQLSETVVKVAASLGSTNVTPEVLADTAAAQGALDALVLSVAGQGENLIAAQAELENSKAAVAQAQAALATATDSAAEATGKLDSLSRDLSTRNTELQALQKKYDSDVAALNKDIADLKSAQAAGAVTMTDADAVVPAEGEAVMAEAGEAGAAVESGAPVASDKSVTLPPGSSHYFKSYSYDAASNSLTLQAIKGGKLTFSEVPATVVDELAAATIFDVYFRFKLMDVYPSKPKDRDFMKGLN